VSDGFEGGDFERAVALVSAERSPRALVERLGIDWDYLTWLAVDASASALAEQAKDGGRSSPTLPKRSRRGFLIGVHLLDEPRPEPERLGAAVDLVQARGRHAVIADHCDLASIGRLETVYSDALVESMGIPADEQDVLRAPVTRVFEAGLAVGIELGSGGDGARVRGQEP
jgi:hypothetical protein